MINLPNVAAAPNGVPANRFDDHLDDSPPAKAGGAPAHHAASPLHDAMEEVSATFGEQVERKSKALQQRQIGRPEGRLAANVERIEKLVELFELLEHPQQPSLEHQARLMRAQLTQAAPPTVTALLDAAGNDATRGDILLRQTLYGAQQRQDTALAQRARDALAQLHQQRGAEVRAGLNTVRVIARHAVDAAHKPLLRELYYQNVVRQPSVGGLLDALLERFDAAHFAAGLRTLQRALAADIAALAPSISRPALDALLSGLNAAARLGNTLSVSQNLLEQLADRLPECRLGAVDLTRRLIGISANGAYARDLQNLGREAGGQDPLRQALFFNALLPLLVGLPLPLWRDMKNRFAALQLLRALIGDLADPEPPLTLRPPRQE